MIVTVYLKKEESPEGGMQYQAESAIRRGDELHVRLIDRTNIFPIHSVVMYIIQEEE